MGGTRTTMLGSRVGAAAGLGALLVTVGCSAPQGNVSAAQFAAAAQPVTPVVVGCEPNQRTLVRPSVVNGVAVSQVECVSTSEIAVATQNLTTPSSLMPVSYTQAAYTAPAGVTRQADLGDTRIIPSSYPTRTAARPVPARQVVYDDDRPVRVEKPQRSVKKSAIIIGSSAGVGAGVGAAVGGKKGALIGAVIGGGGATLWDQVTRRK